MEHRREKHPRSLGLVRKVPAAECCSLQRPGQSARRLRRSENRIGLRGRGEQSQNTFEVFSFSAPEYAPHLVSYVNELPRACRDEVRRGRKHNGQHHAAQYTGRGAAQRPLLERGKFHLFYATTRFTEVNRS